ncbi:hypothetical protein BOX15_Mlig028961g1 [Macrostomum lignano]|uniref:Mos1 transposase HTH domain-containing protein n=1 Tax=Macrostomum lignano TaxID=282301 RepID=A0A267EZV0_9PLAT|nr:hypothetical protein BOX15_Mlig028961g2 [Macrostomum lignano]PAA67045.1 hypothetical protein BOX15_Mlig028961g1 [Macrostomum lignano]
METSKDSVRFYIFMCMQLGCKVTEIHTDLVNVLADSAPSFDTVARWLRHFLECWDSFNDEPRSGRPRTSVTEDVVAHADAIIREDWSIMLRFIAYELGVSYGSAHNIMHEQLGRTKTCARWVPHLLTPEQQAERVRICRL